MPECKLKNITVHYEEYGEGKPIIMIHGYYPDHRLMSGCMEPIFANRAGYRRIYPDLPGMGMTKGEFWIDNSDKMLDVVLDFIDAVIPGQSFLLAGESYGGYLSRGIVCRRVDQVDGLLLLCPVIGPNHSERILPPKEIAFRDEAWFSTLSGVDTEDFESMAVIQTKETWERYDKEIACGVRIADVDFLEELRRKGYAFTFEVDSLASPYQKPTVFLLGKQDASVGYKDAWTILDNYPKATFAALDQAGHNLQLEQPEVFNSLVREWLDRVERAAG